jgi:transposase-like protein
VEFKPQVVERMKTCQNIHELAPELNIERELLYTWSYQFERRPEPPREPEPLCNHKESCVEQFSADGYLSN